MEIFLARTQGFCAGVASAIDIVERALAKYGSPLYVHHEIVHNTYVVSDFRRRGVVFVDNIADIPEGQHVVFSAHGVPPSVIEEAKKQNLHFIDATCPLVTKVHNEAIRFSEAGYEVVLIGHKGHQELIGTSGYVHPERLHIVETSRDIEELNIPFSAKVAFVTQTTLSIDESQELVALLKRKFPNLTGPSRDDICYATTNRQEAVKELARLCDIIIICGSPNSSNSNRLRETGERCGTQSVIIDKAAELAKETLEGKSKIGISSGASVPRVIVDNLVERIKGWYPETIVHTFENPEKEISFALPPI